MGASLLALAKSIYYHQIAPAYEVLRKNLVKIAIIISSMSS